MKRKRTVLVTGANGYLGSVLTRKLAEVDAEVIAIVRAEDSNLSKIKEIDNSRIVVCPMEKIKELPTLVNAQIDCCFHLAWFSGDKLRKHDIVEQEGLIRDSLLLMDAVQIMGCKRFVGTGSILETNANLPLAQHPNMVYAVTKDCANKLLAIKAQEYDMQYTWCRLCGLYGEDDKTGNLISYTIKQLKAGKSPEYSSGQQPYSFVHVEDCARLLMQVGENNNVPELVTIPGPECKSVKEYMEILQRLVAPSVELKFGVRPDDGIRYRQEMFDNAELKKIFGFEYEHDFEKEIKKLMEKGF